MADLGVQWYVKQPEMELLKVVTVIYPFSLQEESSIPPTTRI